jgi:tripartite-type tricarboxylate transporter receptor subunit TctC
MLPFIIDRRKVLDRGVEWAQFAAGAHMNVNHLAAELFNLMAGVKLVHVPYKGGGPMMTDLLGGHISLLCATIGTLGPHVRTGKVRALGVTTATRSPAFPVLPTIDEAGPSL